MEPLLPDSQTSKTSCVAVIPARGGSKRIPRKNIKPFCGQPMIAWPIMAAQKSGLFDRIIVSTDDAKIADVARACGAEVPFMRPAEIADDMTPTRDVIIHAITALEAMSQTIDLVCCIYATAPFVTDTVLKAAHAQLISDSTVDFIFAAGTFAYPVQRALIYDAQGGVQMLDPAQARTRSQDLPEAFHDAGQFYWGRRDAFVARTPMFGASARPHLLHRLDVQDIDTPEDWQVAETLFRLRKDIQA